MNEWIYNNEILLNIEDYIGFVYQITNITNGKKYIGKKNFYFIRSKMIKKKKKKVKIESDWKSYYGSNKILLEDVKTLGKDNFKREIIVLCKTKSEFAYFEAKLQFDNNVLLSDEYYNEWIMVRIHKKHLNSLINKDII